jgi:diketogulonate reductase-like aldo/keto reductase
MTPSTKLNDSREIPQVGLGLWKVTDKTAFDRAFTAALDAGYRHFDTAQVYGNEAWLGEAVAHAGLAREKFWLTTKLSANTMVIGKAAQTIPESLRKLQTDYVDLLLIHFPVPIARKSAWKLLEKLQADGTARSIGVSNYGIHHLEHMRRYAKIVPAVNQIEMHIFLQRPELMQYCHDNGIAVEAYSPLAHATDTSNPVIQAIATKHHKSYAQIMLRWCIQQGAIVLPKSVTPTRIRENMQLFDFELDDDDMAKLQTLNRNLYTCRPTMPARFIP